MERPPQRLTATPSQKGKRRCADSRRLAVLLIMTAASSYPRRVAGFGTSLTALQLYGGNYQTLHASRLAPPLLSKLSQENNTPTIINSDAGAGESEADSLLLSPLETSSISINDDGAVNHADTETRKKTMLFLLWTIAWLSALDRVAMSLALLPISQEFGYTDAVKGSISSLFSVGYGLAVLPAGLLVANASPRVVMASGLALWSVSTIATPAATSLAVENMVPLLFVRACVGAGESVILPTIQKLLQAWMRPDEKSFALAVVISGFQAGTITAYLLSPEVMQYLGGWQSLFYMYGGAGLFILVPWLIFAQDAPADNTTLVTSSEPPASPSAPWDDSIQSFRDAPWNEFARSKAVWAMGLTHCSKNWALYNALAWTPIFYSEQYGIGVRDSAWLSVLPSIAGTVGGFVSGYFADAAVRKLKAGDEVGIANIRKLFQGLSQFGPAVAYAALALHIPEEPWAAQAYLMVAFGLMSFGAAGIEVAVQEKAGKRWVGLLYSVTSLPAVMVGTLGVYVTGQVLEATSSDWGYVFGINACVNAIGATAFVTLYDSKREFE